MSDPLHTGSDAAWDSEIELLAQTLPTHLYQALHDRIDPTELLEIVLDLGREPEARVPGREVLLGDRPVTAADLDYVANHSRKADVKVAISNSFGFGGHNATLVIKKTEPN